MSKTTEPQKPTQNPAPAAAADDAHDLVEALRHRMIADGLEPENVVRDATDMQILNAYLCCSRCHKPLIDWPQRFESVDAFMKVISDAMRVHPCTRNLKITGLPTELRPGIMDLRAVEANTMIAQVISRAEVERQLYQWIEHPFALDRLPKGADLVKLRGCVHLQIQGYEQDPRELHQIPEVRQFIAGLVSHVPWILFFTTLPTAGLIISCLFPNLAGLSKEEVSTAAPDIADECVGILIDLVFGTTPVLSRAELEGPAAESLMCQLLTNLDTHMAHLGFRPELN